MKLINYGFLFCESDCVLLFLTLLSTFIWPFYKLALYLAYYVFMWDWGKGSRSSDITSL